MIDVNDLKDSGLINDYFYSQLKNKDWVPESLLSPFIDEAKIMTGLGINSSEYQKLFYYITMYVPYIAKEISVQNLGKVDFARISAEVFKNLKQYPINTILGLYRAVEHALGILNLEKKAYPQGFGLGIRERTPKSVYQWMTAMRDIYSRVDKGFGFAEAFDKVTKNWDKMDKIEFKNWMKFYQEGAHEKYKIAQYVSDNGFYLPNSGNLRAKLPRPIRHENEIPKPKPDVNEVRDTIERQRERIISRLNAAEKLLCSLDGQFFAGDDQDKMLNLLHELKRKVQTANKITIQSSLFEDFIWRAGNWLKLQDKHKPAEFFYKIAQGLNLPPPIPDPSMGGGMEMAPTTTFTPQSEITPEITQNTHDALKEFFALLESDIPKDDEDDEDEENKAHVPYKAAQEIPMQNAPVRPAPGEADIEVEETPRTVDVEDKVDSALSDITVEDIVKELETISTLFKDRVISKRLALIDLMMDSLGIGGYFPSLGEATRSALESNQYVSTRIEEILNRLRSGINIDESEELLDEKRRRTSPATEALKSTLEDQEIKERERRDRRRQKEEGKEEQAGRGREVREEIAEQPVRVAPTRPITPRQL